METLRPVNVGAEKWLKAGAIKVLDKGYIRMTDYMGTDDSVARAARQSYDKQDEEKNAEGLINFLMREWHTSPFEQPAVQFQVKAPILVFREWHRHRLARLNEMSGRYTQLEPDFYIPETSKVQYQSKLNKQGSGEPLPEDEAAAYCFNLISNCEGSYHLYEKALRSGIAKEIARICLPVNTYSKMVWQSDLRNILGFLKLRTARTAQYEIRMYANVMAEMIQDAFPLVWSAFDEYVLHSITLSKTELDIIRKMIKM